ncbi:MAG TPA: Sec-dependent nitrous-oxide reductase [Acidimicrobiales bacterium]|nr:Sec-dependent nitrous-oxide reductase [Acidimicrobiales bacterium]
MSRFQRSIFIVAVISSLSILSAACSTGSNGGSSVSSGALDIAIERGLSDSDINAALMTYTPSGQIDEYIMFASGGHGGQVFVIGMPSMRLLKTIGVFTPEPWQGYGYGDESHDALFESGKVGDNELTWGDTHHPALSETAGDYDGQFLFINDKANARVAVIDLRDFETKQTLKNPLAVNDHGGTFVTPDTEWVIEGGQYSAPLAWDYAPLDDFSTEYRGMITFWKFDRSAGRINENASFAIELPPYWQDVCDSGKKVSQGWVFCNSINVEMATGMDPDDPEGSEPFESGVSAGENDYLHIINLEKAVEVAAAGNTVEVNGFPMITLDTAVEEDLLFFTPEPKSPHGVDIAPGGDYIVVSGKLDPHVTVYSFEKIQEAIAAGGIGTDDYGVKLLDFDQVVEAQVEVGLGPLHTQFDDQGYAYTSLFLDSDVARWSLGDPYREDGWKLEGTLDIHYNIGHLVTAEGDTVSPDGKYLVALNKWSLDRFFHPGPLYPQNFQLVDISQPGDQMQLLYDMPVGNGEPHYAQIIKADKLSPYTVYPEVGWDPSTMAVDPDAPQIGTEGVIRDGDNVTVNMTLVRSHFTPERVEVRQGDHVTWNLTNVEMSEDATHGFAIAGYNINLSLEPGETATVEFDATEDGVFTYYCTEFCSALHLEMAGYFLVEPEE